MMPRRIFIGEYGLTTGFGPGVKTCMENLYGGRHAFRPIDFFEVPSGITPSAAFRPEIRSGGRASVMRLLEDFSSFFSAVPKDCGLFFGTTLGEIDELAPESGDTVNLLFRRFMKKWTFASGKIISAACASGNIAIIRAAEAIRAGEMEHAVAAGCDIASEFTCSGFASLRALTKSIPRPFDRDRDGLLLGDAAGFLHLMSEEYALRTHAEIIGEILGTGMSCDAIHITAPDLTGRELALAMKQAQPEETAPSAIAAVVAHGTGTVLNDAMEIAALNRFFADMPPVVSAKGGCGHTLGAAGFMQAACALEILNRKEIFPQTNLLHPEPDVNVSDRIRPVSGSRVLTLNAGFGGINAVICFGRSQ